MGNAQRIDALLAELRRANAALDDGRGPRTASKAAAIGNGRMFDAPPRRLEERPTGKAARRLAKGIYGDDDTRRLGDMLTAVYQVRSGGTPDEYYAGKATLDGLGMLRQDRAPNAGYAFVGGDGKATLGEPGSAGGYVLPNNLVDSVQKPKTQRAVYSQLVTVVNGVAVRGVDMPYRTGAPTRMTIAPWGDPKENVSEVYGTYTSTLVTLARIYDVGKQYLRFSAGSAEQDVMDELVKSATLGENFYILAGTGTGSGSSTNPEGIYTALIAAGGTYTTSSSPAASTILGSAAKAFADMLGDLMARNRDPEAIVCDALTYRTLVAQGTDASGFFLAPAGGPGEIRMVNPNQGFRQDAVTGGLTFWGVPVYYDSNFNTNTGTTKGAIAAEWSAFRLYRGMEFRIESSDVAGNRWDYNLVGFRAEEEIGFNALTGVTVGAAQWCAQVIP